MRGPRALLTAHVPPGYIPTCEKLWKFGARHEHRKRLAEHERGNPFVAYIAGRRIYDGHGGVTSNPFEDDLRWALVRCKEPSAPLRTHSANMRFCCGGFVETTRADYESLVTHLGTEGV